MFGEQLFQPRLIEMDPDGRGLLLVADHLREGGFNRAA
jgi:hypothetical protein